MNQQSEEFKPVYFLQRPCNPVNIRENVKSNKNLSLTLGANQTASNFLPMRRTLAVVNQQFMNDSPMINQEDRLDKLES